MNAGDSPNLGHSSKFVHQKMIYVMHPLVNLNEVNNTYKSKNIIKMYKGT